MICAWQEFLSLLPRWMQQDVDTLGRDSLQELRLRINSPPQLNLGIRKAVLKRTVVRSDLEHVINAASGYSPWTAATISKGYLASSGGHRIGICGDAIVEEGVIRGIRSLYSLCIRIARDFPGIGNRFLTNQSALILGAPGWGKTTLLRDIARTLASDREVAVIDERGELFPDGFSRGRNMDVLRFCPKPQGMDMLLKTMGPACIAMDEITSEEDGSALLHAARCGVQLLAAVHAVDLLDLSNRPIYRSILDAGIFENYIALGADKMPHILKEAAVC